MLQRRPAPAQWGWVFSLASYGSPPLWPVVVLGVGDVCDGWPVLVLMLSCMYVVLCMWCYVCGVCRYVCMHVCM